VKAHDTKSPAGYQQFFAKDQPCFATKNESGRKSSAPAGQIAGRFAPQIRHARRQSTKIRATNKMTTAPPL